MPLFDYDQTGLSLPNAVHATHRVPGGRRVRDPRRPRGQRPAGSEPVELALWVDGEQVGRVARPRGRRLLLRGPAGLLGQDPRVPRAADAPASTGSRPRSCASTRACPRPTAARTRRSGPRRLRREFKPREGRDPEQIEAARKKFEERLAEKAPANEARVRASRSIGPFEPVRGPSDASLQQHLRLRPSPRRPRRRLRAHDRAPLARRAFRRPVTAPRRRPACRASCPRARASGATRSRKACAWRCRRAGVARLPVPHREGRRGAADSDRRTPSTARAGLAPLLFPVGQHARRRAAARWPTGHAARPEVLAAQVRRMLKDAKAGALVENFGGQWLQFRALESVDARPRALPEFDNNLRLSMRKETELFFESIVREDRSILDFLDGKLHVPERAPGAALRHPGREGPEFRRVDLTGHARAAACSPRPASSPCRPTPRAPRRCCAASGCSRTS